MSTYPPYNVSTAQADLKPSPCISQRQSQPTREVTQCRHCHSPHSGYTRNYGANAATAIRAQQPHCNGYFCKPDAMTAPQLLHQQRKRGPLLMPAPPPSSPAAIAWLMLQDPKACACVRACVTVPACPCVCVCVRACACARYGAGVPVRASACVCACVRARACVRVHVCALCDNGFEVLSKAPINISTTIMNHHQSFIAQQFAAFEVHLVSDDIFQTTCVDSRFRGQSLG
jgi:hypothetical protein